MDNNRALIELADKIQVFANETNMLFENGSTQPATKGDLAALSNEIYYVFTAIESALKAAK